MQSILSCVGIPKLEAKRQDNELVLEASRQLDEWIGSSRAWRGSLTHCSMLWAALTWPRRKK